MIICNFVYITAAAVWGSDILGFIQRWKTKIEKEENSFRTRYAIIRHDWTTLSHPQPYTPDLFPQHTFICLEIEQRQSGHKSWWGKRTNSHSSLETSTRQAFLASFKSEILKLKTRFTILRLWTTFHFTFCASAIKSVVIKVQALLLDQPS